jgi:hypothetical protein
VNDNARRGGVRDSPPQVRLFEALAPQSDEQLVRRLRALVQTAYCLWDYQPLFSQPLRIIDS